MYLQNEDLVLKGKNRFLFMLLKQIEDRLLWDHLQISPPILSQFNEINQLLFPLKPSENPSVF